MIRGTTKLTCDRCGHRFAAPDIEWQGTSLSTPQACPACGSSHTWPASGWAGALAGKAAYRRIWEQLDQKR